MLGNMCVIYTSIAVFVHNSLLGYGSEGKTEDTCNYASSDQTARPLEYCVMGRG